MHLEDNLEVADLKQQVLKNDGLDCEVQVITSSVNYLMALEAGDHDLVLSESVVPGIDALGLGALQLALRHKPEAPFVFISGHLEAQSSIDKLKAAGAAECLHKSDMIGVGKTVRRILQSV